MDRSDADEVRHLLRTIATGALGTLDTSDRGPYVSRVQVAVDATLFPLFLLSGLARHTRNLTADPRGSLLLDSTAGHDDGVSGSRMTLIGRIETVPMKKARDLMLARHPPTAAYIDFADFAFYRLDWTEVHLVAGFGRISTLPRSHVSTMG